MSKSQSRSSRRRSRSRSEAPLAVSPPRPSALVDVRKQVQMHLVAGPPLDGWVHTHGMADLGLPELEARQIPRYLMQPTAHLLWTIAEYMLDSDRPVLLGDTMHAEGYGKVTLRKLAPYCDYPSHYADERWAIVDEGPPLCECCSPAE